MDRSSNLPINFTDSTTLEDVYQFSECGRILYRSNSQMLHFEMDDIEKFSQCRGVVYVWALSKLNVPYLEVVYVGSTKSTVFYRSNVWKGALNEGVKKRRHSTEQETAVPKVASTARRMRKLIDAALSEGGEISVWARASSYGSVFGRSCSLYKVEEDALIDIFKPTWNGYK